MTLIKTMTTLPIQSNQELTLSFISLRVKEYIEGCLSSVKQVSKEGVQEILTYMDFYEPINCLEYE
jgi:hypothetical protein